MRAVGEDTVHFEPFEPLPGEAGGPGPSLFARAAAGADRASRAGFVLSVMFLLAVAAYAVWLSGAAVPVLSEVVESADAAAYNAGFRLEDLALVGASNTPRAALLEALMLPYGKSSLRYSVKDAHDRLMELGWIEQASVRRVLPSRLEVSISERSPFARFLGNDGVIRVIDRQGHLLGDDGEGHFKSLLLFSGDGAPAVAASLFDSLSASPALRARIARAELVAERFWTVTLDNGLSVKLPRKVSALTLDRLETLLLNPKTAEMALETVDLRLPRRTILRLKEDTLANRDRAIASLTGSAPPTAAPVQRRGRWQ